MEQRPPELGLVPQGRIDDLAVSFARFSGIDL
jgi:ribosomal protein L16 Arg81 hydroxylase